ncbi:hypothetical protein K443DRAFT_3468 [Laccaria amethystina LaAM-08-1]|uniref:Uncharacterized protein n=1 Tax=Laccaria amethystina LaAM-08-1 TaxID=1095629 RepID=A0A0C9X1E0_9AGAR|nr:hypothetical protein K443DRAFT_3468 [Laccaria amethystina LaAM-08-1]
MEELVEQLCYSTRVRSSYGRIVYIAFAYRHGIQQGFLAKVPTLYYRRSRKRFPKDFDLFGTFEKPSHHPDLRLLHDPSERPEVAYFFLHIFAYLSRPDLSDEAAAQYLIVRPLSPYHCVPANALANQTGVWFCTRPTNL